MTTLGPIGSPRAMAFEPADAEPEPDDEAADEAPAMTLEQYQSWADGWARAFNRSIRHEQ